MINATKSKWLLRLILPAVAFLIPMLCGRTLGGAVGILLLSAFLVVVFAAMPFTLIGLLFVPIVTLYGVKFSSQTEPEIDLRDPDTQLFLGLSIPATLTGVGLLSLYLP